MAQLFIYLGVPPNAIKRVGWGGVAPTGGGVGSGSSLVDPLLLMEAVP